RIIFDIARIGQARCSKGSLLLKLAVSRQRPVMRAVIEIGQRIQKARRRVGGDIPAMRRQRRAQKQRIGICRLELTDIERRRKIVREDTLADTDRTVELIVVEKAATTARGERGLVAERRERVGKTVVETA